jgi:hypothetical protein
MYTLLLKQSPFIIFGALIAGGILAAVNFAYLLPQAREEGRAQYVAEQAVLDKKIQLQRNQDDEKIRGMDDYSICIEYVGKLPECESLKLQRLR